MKKKKKEKKIKLFKKNEVVDIDTLIKEQLSKNVNSLMAVFYEADIIKNHKFFANRTQRKAAEDLIKKFGVEQAISIAKIAIRVRCQPYAPVITTPLELKNKLIKLKLFFDRKKIEEENKKRNVAIMSDDDFEEKGEEITENEKKIINDIKENFIL